MAVTKQTAANAEIAHDAQRRRHQAEDILGLGTSGNACRCPRHHRERQNKDQPQPAHRQLHKDQELTARYHKGSTVRTIQPFL